jgi:small-conductance mechanosensitive channel
MEATLALAASGVQNSGDLSDAFYRGTTVASALVELFQTYRGFFERVLMFAIAFIIIGSIAGVLLRRIVFAWDPSARQVPAEDRDTVVRICLECVNLVAWTVALVFATEVVGLNSIASFVALLAGVIVVAPAALLVAGLIVYSFSDVGNRLVSGIVGCVYLNAVQRKWRDRGREFDVGDGLMGKIERVSLMHTAFKMPDGETETKPNALLMHQWFGLGGK